MNGMDTATVEAPPLPKIKFKPLHDGVLVKPHDPESKSPGGIILPDTSKKPMNKGVVVAVGKGRWVPDKGVRLPMEVKVGQTVIWLQFSASEVKVGGVTYGHLRESEIVGVEDYADDEADEVPASMPTPKLSG